MNWDSIPETPEDAEEYNMGRREQPPVDFEGVEVVGETKSGKALKCKFNGGRVERLVPLSQIVESPELGDTGTLRITGWLAERWEEEGDPEMDTVDIEDVVVLKDSEKGIQVRGPSFDRPMWIPKKGVHPDSEVQVDGEGPGTLTLHRWCAEMKGLVEGGNPQHKDSVERDAREGEADWDDDGMPF